MIDAQKFYEEAVIPFEEYHYKIYSSITEIDKTIWDHIVDENDLSMNQQLIELTEKSLAAQAKFWVVVFFHQDKPTACACLSFFRTDIIQSAPLFLQKTFALVRQYYANILKLGVLFCGLPVPCGHTHMRFKDESQQAFFLDQLIKIMENLAQKEKASLIVFKEFNLSQVSQFEILKKNDFLQGDVQPVHELPFSFNDFDHYLQNLRSRYKHQIKSNLRKFNPQEFDIQHIQNPDEIYQQYTDEVHQLYLAVWQNSKERLEQFPADFFKNLGYALPGRTAFTLIKQREKPIAFSIGIRNQKYYYNLYCGLDYSLKEELDLYFNLFYQELDAAFKQQVDSIFLGQTSDYFKSRLGSKASPRYFFVKGRHMISHLGLKLFKSFIFPKPAIIKDQQVLRN